MERSDVEQKLRDIYVDRLGVDEDEVENGTRIIDDLGGDSLDIVEITMDVEKEFGFVITDDEVEYNFNRPFTEVVDFLAEKVGV